MKERDSRPATPRIEFSTLDYTRQYIFFHHNDTRELTGAGQTRGKRPQTQQMCSPTSADWGSRNYPTASQVAREKYNQPAGSKRGPNGTTAVDLFNPQNEQAKVLYRRKNLNTPPQPGN